MTNTPLDCLIFGNVEYSVKERLLTSDPISQKCCRRQYINYNNKHYFYNEFFSLLKPNDKKQDNYQYHDGDFSINEIPFYPVIYLSEYLKQHEFSTQVINHFDLKNLDIVNFLNRDIKAIVVSMGPSSSSLPLVKIVKFIRSINSTVKIIAGGYYVYNKWATSEQTEWNKTMAVINADFYVVNISGEKTICDLLTHIKRQESYADLKNIFIVEANRIIFNGISSSEIKLDSHIVNWDCLDEYKVEKIVSISTSKGCPFHCSFCNFPIKNRKFELASVDTIEKQLIQIEQKNVKFVLFNDDTFNVPLERFKNICDMIIRNKFSFEWFCYLRLKECDEEAIILMKKSKCKGVFLGIESANDCILKNMNKEADVGDFEKGINWLKKHGILTFAFFLIGFPGETKETIRRTIDFIEKSGIDFYTANLWYADSSTPIYQYKDKYKLKGKHFQWEHATMNSKEASEFTDYIFLNVNNAVWVPNEKFGFQGIPYLMSKGYALEEIKQLLKYARKLVESNLKKTKVNKNIIREMYQIINHKSKLVLLNKNEE